MSATPSSSNAPEQRVNVLTALSPLGIHLVAVFSFFVGMVLTFFGQKLLKTCMFAFGFAAGFLFSAVICAKFNTLENVALSQHTVLYIAIVGGGFLGGLAALLVTVTKVVLALGCGVAVAFAVSSAGLSVGGQDYVMWVALVLVFLVVLFVAFKIFDHATVVVTSFVGALAVVSSVAHFIPSVSFSLLRMLSDPSSIQHCSGNQACHGLLVGWVVLFCGGLVVQFKRLDKCGESKEKEESEMTLL